jgi:hypothetical protein
MRALLKTCVTMPVTFYWTSVTARLPNNSHQVLQTPDLKSITSYPVRLSLTPDQLSFDRLIKQRFFPTPNLPPGRLYELEHTKPHRLLIQALEPNDAAPYKNSHISNTIQKGTRTYHSPLTWNNRKDKRPDI